MPPPFQQRGQAPLPDLLLVSEGEVSDGPKFQDIRYGIRSLGKRPAATLVALVTLLWVSALIPRSSARWIPFCCVLCRSRILSDWCRFGSRDWHRASTRTKSRPPTSSTSAIRARHSKGSERTGLRTSISPAMQSQSVSTANWSPPMSSRFWA